MPASTRGAIGDVAPFTLLLKKRQLPIIAFEAFA
jgi:hypothetical protein